MANIINGDMKNRIQRTAGEVLEPANKIIQATMKFRIYLGFA